MLISHIYKCHPGHDKSTFRALSGTIKHEEQNWLCPYCERKYLSSGKRREHIKKAHPDQPIPPSIKKAGREGAHVNLVQTSQRNPHICPYCPMEYAHRTKLLKHCKGKRNTTSSSPPAGLPYPESHFRKFQFFGPATLLYHEC